MALPEPDLAARPHTLTIERDMRVSAGTFYRAWTAEFDRWFAAPGTLAIQAKVDGLFFFETRFEGGRHPHYGRFLELDENRRVRLTWVTGSPGTQGAETVVTIDITPRDPGCRVRLTHAGFADADTCNGHKDAWPMALAHLDDSFAGDAAP